MTAGWLRQAGNPASSAGTVVGVVVVVPLLPEASHPPGMCLLSACHLPQGVGTGWYRTPVNRIIERQEEPKTGKYITISRPHGSTE